MHNTRFVEPQTRRRIEEAIVAPNYTPNIRARQLRTGKTNVVLSSEKPLARLPPAAMTVICDGGGVNVRDDGAGNSMRYPGAAGANPLDAVSFDAKRS